MKEETSLEVIKSPTDKLKEVLALAGKKGTFLGLSHTQIETALQSISMQITQALPNTIPADRMIQISTQVISKNDKIKECQVKSILGAIISASVLGLNPVLDECYLVPFKRKVKIKNDKGESVDDYIQECQLQIGYQGYLKLARQSGEIKTIFAYPVKKKDIFRYELGLNPVLEHKPFDDFDNAGETTHYYAVAHYKDGGYNFVVLTKAQVETYRLRSPMQKYGMNGAWSTDYDAMGCKTAIRRLAKFMPKSDTMNIALKIDEKKIDYTQIQKGELNVPDIDMIEDAEVIEEQENIFKDETQSETQAKEKKK